MVNLTIDGRAIQAEPGKTVLEVAKENGIFIKLMAERRAIPVTIPGRASGRTSINETASFPKKSKRYTAAAASVPRMRAAKVASDATLIVRSRASCMAGFARASGIHFKVKPGGGKV